MCAYGKAGARYLNSKHANFQQYPSASLARLMFPVLARSFCLAGWDAAGNERPVWGSLNSHAAITGIGARMMRYP